MGVAFDARITSVIGDEDVWLTPEEVSRITGFKVGTLNTWRGRRKGPPSIVAGRSVRYSAYGLRAWMNEQVRTRGGSPRG